MFNLSPSKFSSVILVFRGLHGLLRHMEHFLNNKSSVKPKTEPTDATLRHLVEFFGVQLSPRQKHVTNQKSYYIIIGSSWMQ